MTGYRLYGEADVELLTFIRRARGLGLHLDGIREVIAVRQGGHPSCITVRDLLDSRIAEADTAIAELVALRRTLAETRERADDCAGDDPVTVCGIIEEAPTARPEGQESVATTSRI
ncbi:MULTISPECIES: MerR family DNA-binding protein [unclassified Streptomyces]|uniref:MerR family DNA-binding protein n=1 Tax=unclassified Streptomyces TaxID=2593676 RepID=UPI0037FA57BE